MDRAELWPPLGPFVYNPVAEDLIAPLQWRARDASE